MQNPLDLHYGDHTRRFSCVYPTIHIYTCILTSARTHTHLRKKEHVGHASRAVLVSTHTHIQNTNAHANCTHPHVHVHTHTQICTRTQQNTNAHANYTHPHTYTYTHTQICTRTHACIQRHAPEKYPELAAQASRAVLVFRTARTRGLPNSRRDSATCPPSSAAFVSVASSHITLPSCCVSHASERTKAFNECTNDLKYNLMIRIPNNAYATQRQHRWRCKCEGLWHVPHSHNQCYAHGRF